tara:strand:- start:566 stop:883 length:318 start_codon:yes stop_codon:yes gene_type:complete
MKKKMMKSKGMARGGGAKKKMKNGGRAMKAKGMAKGGKRGGAKMKMKNGGKAMKAKGMSKGGMRGGRRMMMSGGGKTKGNARGGKMTLAALRAAAKDKGYKLVRV